MPDGVQALWGNSFYWIKWLRFGSSSFRAVSFVLQCVTHVERARGESRIQFQILPMGHNPSRKLGSISGLDICLALHLLIFLYIAFFLFSCYFSSFDPSSDQIGQILGRGKELVPVVIPQRASLRPLPSHCVDSPAPDSTLMLGSDTFYAWPNQMHPRSRVKLISLGREEKRVTDSSPSALRFLEI